LLLRREGTQCGNCHVRATIKKISVELSRTIHNVLSLLCDIEQEMQQFAIAAPVEICDVFYESFIAQIVFGRVGRTLKTVSQVFYEMIPIRLIVGAKHCKRVGNVSVSLRISVWFGLELENFGCRYI